LKRQEENLAVETTFSDIVGSVRKLDLESKEELVALIRRWLIEERRDEILRNAAEAEAEYARGESKSGAVEDLMADLYAAD
jgi:hypothetical protein